MTDTPLLGYRDEQTLAREKLARDLRVALDDAEELLRLTAEATGEKVAEARAKATASLQQARARVAQVNAVAAAQGRAAAEATDRYVRAYPWQAISAAAIVGFIVGALTMRR